MGVSPWKHNPRRAVSPEGTTGIETQPFPVAPSGLRARVGLRNHGLTPVATTCRPFGTNGLTPEYAAHPTNMWQNDIAIRVSPWNRHAPATKRRQVVAMGVSPWKRNPQHPVSPEGTTGIETQPFPAAPSRLHARIGPRYHGSIPAVTACRPFGTDEPVRELAVSFHESEKRQSAILARLKTIGFTLLGEPNLHAGHYDVDRVFEATCRGNEHVFVSQSLAV